MANMIFPPFYVGCCTTRSGTQVQVLLALLADCPLRFLRLSIANVAGLDFRENAEPVYREELEFVEGDVLQRRFVVTDIPLVKLYTQATTRAHKFSL